MPGYKNPNAGGSNGYRGGQSSGRGSSSPSNATASREATKQNPSGASKPSYAPRGGSQTPASAPANGSRTGGRGRQPDYEIFLGEITTDDSGKKQTRVIEREVDGRMKWAKVGAIWMDQSGRGLPPMMKLEETVEAGTTLVIKDSNRGGRQ